MNKEVVQKVIAAAGVCSRREAEDLLKRGKVTINGYQAKPGERVSDSDKISVNGKVLKGVPDLVYLMLNKPVAYVCTSRQFEGEKNIFSLIKRPERLVVVGRLDKMSRGLVILTNDGEVVNKLTHPSFEVFKTYLVKLKTEPDAEKRKKIIKNFKGGIDIEETGLALAHDITYEQAGVFRIELAQGMKRQIRRMFEKLGFEVADLMRESIGPIELGELPEGKWRELDKAEIELIKNL